MSGFVIRLLVLLSLVCLSTSITAGCSNYCSSCYEGECQECKQGIHRILDESYECVCEEGYIPKSGSSVGLCVLPDDPNVHFYYITLVVAYLFLLLMVCCIRQINPLDVCSFFSLPKMVIPYSEEEWNNLNPPKQKDEGESGNQEQIQYQQLKQRQKKKPIKWINGLDLQKQTQQMTIDEMMLPEAEFEQQQSELETITNGAKQGEFSIYKPFQDAQKGQKQPLNQINIGAIQNEISFQAETSNITPDNYTNTTNVKQITSRRRNKITKILQQAKLNLSNQTEFSGRPQDLPPSNPQ